MFEDFTGKNLGFENRGTCGKSQGQPANSGTRISSPRPDAISTGNAPPMPDIFTASTQLSFVKLTAQLTFVEGGPCIEATIRLATCPGPPVATVSVPRGDVGRKQPRRSGCRRNALPGGHARSSFLRACCGPGPKHLADCTKAGLERTFRGFSRCRCRHHEASPGAGFPRP